MNQNSARIRQNFGAVCGKGWDKSPKQGKSGVFFLLILVQIFFSFYVNVSKAQATNSQSFTVTSYSRQMWWCKREISNLPWPTIPKTFRIWIRKLLWCLPSRFQIATRWCGWGSCRWCLREGKRIFFNNFRTFRMKFQAQRNCIANKPNPAMESWSFSAKKSTFDFTTFAVKWNKKFY